jgi:hypothetical protein
MAIIGVNGKMQNGKDTVGKIWQYLSFNDKQPGQDFIQVMTQVNDMRLAQTSGWEIKKFAGKLKEIASILTGIPVEDFEKEEVKNSYLDSEWDITEQEPGGVNGTLVSNFTYNMTVRSLLQRVGTDCIRNHLHPDAWLNALFADYKPLISSDGKKIYPNWIITDVRFPNEADAIKKRGGILIRIEKPCPECGVMEGHKMIPHKVQPSEHPSETALDDYQKFDYVIQNDGTIEDLIEKVKAIHDKVCM